MKLIGLMLAIRTLSGRYVVDAIEMPKLRKVVLSIPTDPPSDIKPVHHSSI
jgi:hypothetical protein